MSHLCTDDEVGVQACDGLEVGLHRGPYDLGALEVVGEVRGDTGRRTGFGGADRRDAERDEGIEVRGVDDDDAFGSALDRRLTHRVLDGVGLVGGGGLVGRSRPAGRQEERCCGSGSAQDDARRSTL